MRPSEDAWALGSKVGLMPAWSFYQLWSFSQLWSLSQPGHQASCGH